MAPGLKLFKRQAPEEAEAEAGEEVPEEEPEATTLAIFGKHLHKVRSTTPRVTTEAGEFNLDIFVRLFKTKTLGLQMMERQKGQQSRLSKRYKTKRSRSLVSLVIKRASRHGASWPFSSSSPS